MARGSNLAVLDDYKVAKGGKVSKAKPKLNVISTKPKAGENLTPIEWATRINNAYSRTVEGMLETARLIAEARKHFKGYNSLWKECKEHLMIGDAQASRMAKIGETSAFYIKKNMKCLPLSMSTLYELAQLSDKELEHLFKKGDIHPDMIRDDAVELRELSTKPKKEHATTTSSKAKPEKDNEADDDTVEEENVPEANDKDNTASDDGYFDETDEDVTAYMRRMNNWFNHLEGMIESVAPLEESMEQEGITKLPRNMINAATKAANVLNRLVKQYG